MQPADCTAEETILFTSSYKGSRFEHSPGKNMNEITDRTFPELNRSNEPFFDIFLFFKRIEKSEINYITQ